MMGERFRPRLWQGQPNTEAHHISSVKVRRKHFLLPTDQFYVAANSLILSHFFVPPAPFWRQEPYGKWLVFSELAATLSGIKKRRIV